jgi:hypothetical protein
VSLFLQKHDCGTNLSLFLPCSLDSSTSPPKYVDNGVKDFTKNPGRTSNRYHEQFSKAIGYNSFSDFEKVAQLGASLNCDFFGYHARNEQVAKVEKMMAFTWSNGTEPEKSGTSHTWSHCVGQRLHINLNSLTAKEGKN